MGDEEEMIHSPSGGGKVMLNPKSGGEAIPSSQRGNEEVIQRSQRDEDVMKPRILHLFLELRDHQEELKQLKIKLEDIKYEYNHDKLEYLKTLREKHSALILHNMFIPLRYEPEHTLHIKYIFYHFSLQGDLPKITSLAVTEQDITNQLRVNAPGATVILPPPAYMVQQAQARIDNGYNWTDTSIIYPNGDGIVAMDTVFMIIR